MIKKYCIDDAENMKIIITLFLLFTVICCGDQEKAHSKLIWAGKDVSLRFLDFDTKDIFVVFASFQHEKIDHTSKGQYEDYFFKKKISALFVNPHGNHWYQTTEMTKIFPLMKDILTRFNNVITYGASMGGFAALAFSKELNINKVLAFSPQVILEDYEPDYQNTKKMLGLQEIFSVNQGLSPTAEYYIFYGKYNKRDRIAVEERLTKITEKVGVQKMYAYALPLKTHYIPSKLLEAKVLNTINMAVMKGQKDTLDNLFTQGGAVWNALRAIDD